MGVLHVEDRVLVVLLERQVHFEGELGVGLAADQEEAHRVAAGPVDEVAQGDVAAGALGDLDLLAPAQDGHHLVQHVVRVAGWNAHPCGLQARTHAGDGAVVVAALDVDDLDEAPLPLVDVIRHIGHEVGVGRGRRPTFLCSTFRRRLAHHAVLVVAVVGAAQPQCAVFLVGLAGVHQPLHRLRHPPGGVQAGLEVVVVKAHAEGAQVQVLLVAQVGHRELADAVQVLRVARGGGGAVVGLDRLERSEVGSDVGDVLAVVGVFRPGGVSRLVAQQPRLRGACQRGDLHPGVVVIELPVHLPALAVHQVAHRVAQRRLPAVAHVQRAGRVGRDELHHHLPAVGRLRAEGLAGLQHLAHHRLLGRSRQAQVDEARAGDLESLHPVVHLGLAAQGLDQRLGHFTGVLLQRSRQGHGAGDGQIAVRGLAWGFERGFERGVWGYFGERRAQRHEQRLAGLFHEGDSRGGGCSRDGLGARRLGMFRAEGPVPRS